MQPKPMKKHQRGFIINPFVLTPPGGGGDDGPPAPQLRYDDPYRDFVRMLIQGTETTDDSAGLLFDAQGTMPEVGTTYGFPAMEFDGVTNAMIAVDSEFNPRTGAFCLEGYILSATGAHAYATVFDTGGSGGYTPGFSFEYSPERGQYTNAVTSIAGGPYLADTEQHMFVSRDKFGIVRMGIAGVIVSKEYQPGDIPDAPSNFACLGDYAGLNSIYRHKGTMRGMRYTKGVGRYTGEIGDFYQRPDLPLPEVLKDTDPYWYDTDVIINFAGSDGDDDFTDVRGHTVVKYGTPVIDTAAYPGGALSLDGDSYVAVQELTPYGTNDFTAEIFIEQQRSTFADPGSFQISPGEFGLQPAYEGAVTHLATAGTWHGVAGDGTNLVSSYGPSGMTHVVLQRKDGVLYQIINGKIQGSCPDTTDYAGTAAVIGGYYSTSYLAQGLILGFRSTLNHARYPLEEFCPPVWPFPEIAESA